MRRKRSAPLAVGVMVVRLILQDEIRALKNKPTNYFAGTTKQGKTKKKENYEKYHNQQNSSTHE